MTDTLIEPQVGDPALDQDEPKVAHVIKGKAKVFEAYVEGTPVEALCGAVFVPSRNPDNLVKCEQCLDILGKLRASGGN